MEDGAHVFIRIAALIQKRNELLKIGDCVEIFRALLRSEAAIEIASDRNMARIAGKLADVFDVANDVFERHPRIVWFAPPPSRARASRHRAPRQLPHCAR